MANQPKKYKKFVATAATATLVASAIVPVASAASLSDISGNTHEAAITSLVDAGIINGYADGTFKPNKELTRSDVVKLLGKYLVTQGYEIPSDAVSSPRFADLTSKSNKELLEYAAVVADAGVFAGSNGKLLAGDPITRENMAIVLVRMVNTLKDVSLEGYVAGQSFTQEVKDLNVAKAEARSAINVLDFYDITTATNFLPKNTVTRGQFATFLNNVINADFSGASATTGTVKAINNTTVEVTFADEVKNVEDLKFSIEGLEITNKVVKQTDKKTVVLTTKAQEAGKEYKLVVNEKQVGKFTGVAAVIPTAIDVTTASVQGIIGQDVTVTAEVKVAEGQAKAGIPVTFNIVNNSNTNEKIEVQVLTDDKGVATYKYTRYYASVDNVAAYATQKSSVVSHGKVYWANSIQLSVSELTTGNDLANETKKSYKVTGAKNATYYVAIKENINVTPDKVTQVKVQDHGTTNYVTPYELTTGGTQFARVTTNSNGEGTFTVFGSNLEATPIVYLPSTTNSVSTDYTYDKTALQAQAPTVKFSKVDRLAVTVKGEGTADSAEYAVVPTVANGSSVGGRTYTATVTDKDGKIAPEGTTAYVTFEEGNYAGDVYFTTAAENFQKVVKGSVFPVRVGKEGKATFRVAGKGATTFAKPTVFLNTAGVTSPVALDKGDVQQVGDVTYFKSATVVNATLSVTDQYGRTVTSLNAGQEAFFTYQSVDQNGFAYRPTISVTGSTTVTVWVPVYGKDANNNDILLGYKQEAIQTPGTTVQQYNLIFDVTSTFGNATVKNAAGADINPSQNLGNTKTYQVVSDAEGKAIVRVTSSAADTVSVNVTGASNFLPTQTASVSFVNSSIVPNVHSGDVASYNSQAGTLTFVGKNPVSIFGDKVKYTKGTEVIANYEAFISLLGNAPGTVSITRTVAEDGTTTFNIYNISTSGIKPVDTAVVVSKVALQAAVTAEETANLVEANYTPATWAVYATALTNAKAVLANASATQSVVDAALLALTTAKAGLQTSAPTADAILTATSVAPNDIAAGLNLYTTKVTGTVATADVTSVELTFTNAAGVTHKETVAVTNQSFSFSGVLDLGKAVSVTFNAVTKTIE
jgi:trimeric autotransporter adhesin